MDMRREETIMVCWPIRCVIWLVTFVILVLPGLVAWIFVAWEIKDARTCDDAVPAMGRLFLLLIPTFFGWYYKPVWWPWFIAWLFLV
jgi:hypothetical protein